MVNTDIYIAMAGSHQIWHYNIQNKKMEVYAGNGFENLVDGPRLQAQLAQPSGLSFANNRLYFADSEVSAIRSIDLKTGKVETLVGQGLFTFGLQDGPFDQALFQHPLGLAANEKEIFVADTYNHAIRLINLAAKTVSTLIKRVDKEVCQIGDEDCQLLPLNEPNDVKKVGNFLYIADTNNHLIRVFDLEKRTLQDLKIES